ncbi:MAG: methionyl-tRNA formyltransferase [Bacillota bacterium]
MKDLKIIFMGTPEFALPSLELLNLSLHRIEALVVPPDRPAGRGGSVRYVPTKQWALDQGLAIMQPEDLGDKEAFISFLAAIDPDLIVTVAFGRVLPPDLLNLPPLGCINLHASYLPYYRGAAPIHRAVIDGADHSGVTVIKMSSVLDGGDIIMREKENISPYDTAGMLHDRLADRGASLLLKAINAIASGKTSTVPQDHAKATYAPPLEKNDERIDWNQPSLDIYNRIRGLNPWPGAYTTYEGKRLKIWRAARPIPEGYDNAKIPEKKPGEILAAGEESLKVATADGFLNLLELQPAGKKTMGADSFCCGYRIEPGHLLDGEHQS